MVLKMMVTVYNKVDGLLRREEGQGMVEYGLILGVLAVALIVGFVALRDNLYQAGVTCANLADPTYTGDAPVFNRIVCAMQ